MNKENLSLPKDYLQNLEKLPIAEILRLRDGKWDCEYDFVEYGAEYEVKDGKFSLTKLGRLDPNSEAIDYEIFLKNKILNGGR